MIFLHLILGVILGKIYGSYFFFIAGSLFADIDHIYIYFIKGKFYTWKKFINALKYEDKHGIKSKTPLFHSILGMVIFTGVIYLFNQQGALYFGIAYLSHLLMDWVDKDEKIFLWPLKIEFRGFLPVWSTSEKIVTIIVTIFMLSLFL